MMSELDVLSKTDLIHIHKDDLQEVSQIKINTDLPLKQRIVQFLDEVKNPYCFRIENHAVKIDYSEEGEPLQSVLKKHFVDQKNRTLE